MRRWLLSILGLSIVAATLTAFAGCGQILGLGDPVDGGPELPDAIATTDSGAPGADADAARDSGVDGFVSDAPVEASLGDAGTDASPEAACDLSKPFGTPSLLSGTDLNTAADEGTPRLSPNELTLYFWSDRTTADGGVGARLYSAARNDVGAGFGAPSPMSTVSSGFNDASPTVTGNGLTLVFESDRSNPATTAAQQLFIATRGSTAGTFLTPSLIASTGWPANDKTPFLRPDGQVLYFSGGPGPLDGQDIYRTVLQMQGSFGTADAVAEINSQYDEYSPVVSANELTILWGSNRPDDGNLGSFDILIAERTLTSAPFSGTANAGALVNSSGLDLPGWISPDGCRLYMESDRAGNRDLYLASKP